MPRTDIIFDDDVVMELARNGATDEDIAAHFKCGVSIILNCNKRVIARGRQLMAMDIRRAQIKLALSGNSAMLTFLGKEILNQSGKPTEDDVEKPPTPTKKMTTKQLTNMLEKKK